MAFACSLLYWRFDVLISFYAAMMILGSTLLDWSCEKMMGTSGAVSFTDIWYLSPVVAAGLFRPSPPSLTGRASRSLVSFEHGGIPVIAGMNHGELHFPMVGRGY